MILWRFYVLHRSGTGLGIWTDLPDRFRGDLEAAKQRCRELAAEHDGAVNAVSIDEPQDQAEPVTLAS